MRAALASFTKANATMEADLETEMNGESDSKRGTSATTSSGCGSRSRVVMAAARPGCCARCVGACPDANGAKRQAYRAPLFVLCETSGALFYMLLIVVSCFAVLLAHP
jgi:hypothetical protein